MQESLSARDKKVIWHPYTHQKYNPDPIPIVKGEGAWLIDDQGNRYLDAVSSWWVTIHGHGHPYIAESIYRQALQLEQVIFTGFTHRPAVELAEKLLAILPNEFSKVFYSDNGSTSTEVAIKMAIQYWWNKGNKKRTRIIALTNSYHGDTFGAMSISERGIFTMAFQDRLFDVLFAITPEKNTKISFRDHAEEDTGQLLEEAACVIYEPLLQGSSGMKMYEPAALDHFLDQCRAHNVICIADEVLTGFGRTGKLFASEYCRNRPDIICLSKGLTGGTMALGVTACTENIHSAFVNDDKLKSLFHGHSFTANPIACSAALASLELLTEDECQQNIQRIAAQQEAFCQQIAVKKNIRNIRRCGTIMAFEINDQTDNYTSNVREIITEKALKKGVYLRPLGNTVYIMPPYCITVGELEKVHAVLTEILSEFN
jgi:adenosylmethionine-8-amino-7-oxononanoate aminotransferase